MRVTFRADFAGPKGLLNPSGWKIPNPPAQTVEVYRKGEKWYARAAHNGEPFGVLGSGPTHGTMKDAVATAFETQLSEWTLYDSDGKFLDLAMVEEDQHGKFTLKLETHIAGPDQAGMPGNEFKTACGIVVGAARIRSKRGYQPPDCKACKVEWAKTKPEERIKS